MIKHDYAGCNQCHADPSGGGVLTEYGRAQSDFLLRMRYGAKDSWEAPPSAEFLFGAFKLPSTVLLGGDIRYATITKSSNGMPTPTPTPPPPPPPKTPTPTEGPPARIGPSWEVQVWV
jgi:hypothetical protein